MVLGDRTGRGELVSVLISGDIFDRQNINTVVSSHSVDVSWLFSLIVRVT